MNVTWNRICVQDLRLRRQRFIIRTNGFKKPKWLVFHHRPGGHSVCVNDRDLR